MTTLIKKKISTLLNLIIKGEFLKLIKTLFGYIRIFIIKTGIIQIPCLPYYFLTYYNLINKKFIISPDIEFGHEDNKFFKDKLFNCNLYLEYGSGSSTLLADEKNINYYSVESDKNFHKVLKKYLKNGNYLLKDFGIVKNSSSPVLFTYTKLFYRNRAKKYAGDVFHQLNEKSLVPDLILIDGRYRVLCALYVYKFLKARNSTSTIIIDDYITRHYLHVVSNFFEGKTIGRFGVFNKLKKLQDKEIDDLIKIHSLDQR